VVSDAEWFSHPQLQEIPIDASIQHLQPNLRGIVCDGKWKDRLSQIYGNDVLIPEQGGSVDAQRILTSRDCDVKLFGNVISTEYDKHALVYISHAEYLHGKKHDTLFCCYQLNIPVNNSISLISVFSFAEAKECSAIQLYTRGKWVHCEQTNKQEPPWSIDLFMVNPKLRASMV
jgi:L-cysteine desulfidase